MRLFLRLLLSFWLGLACACTGAAAQAPAALALDDSRPVVAAWPAVQLLADPGGELSAEQAAARLDRFETPRAPTASLGHRREVLWLRVPLRVDGGDGQWLLDIDYAPMNEVQVHLLHRGRVQMLATLGAAQPFAQRPLHTRSHALMLPLQPGQAYELLLRVHTESAVILPISLMKADALHARELPELLGQGLMLGVALALLVYSLTHWVGLREPLFGCYAGMVLGSSLFFLDFFGVLQSVLQYERSGLAAKLSPLSVLMAMSVGPHFVIRAMDMRLRNPRLCLALRGLAAFSLFTLVAGLLGLLSYRQTQLLATIVGPLVPLLVIPAAWQRARAGEAVGRWMLLGWGAYVVGACTTAALLRGLLPANFLSMHLFQFGTVVEMLAWLRVLGMHTEALRAEALRSEAEKRSYERLALTDALTGLPNRRALMAALSDELARSAGPAAPLLGVYFLDLDGFKAVNDRLGHEAGDELLKQVAQRLKASLRHTDTVARLGGDEFVIVARGLALEAEARQLGHKLLERFDPAFQVQGQDCRVGLTVGFALAPLDSHEAPELLRLADAAMYAGKQAGRHQVRRAVVAGAPA